MLRNVFKVGYVPTLCIRPAEMRALEELPEADKDRLFPFIMLSPWVGSNELISSINRIEKAYGSRSFILALDRYYRADQADRNAQKDYLSIQRGEDDYGLYFSFLENIEQAIPCAFLNGDNVSSLKKQIDRNLKLNRGCVVSLDKARSKITDGFFKLLASFSPDDVAVHIDGGWSRNHLTESLFYINLVSGIFQHAPRFAVILSCSSFPKGFGTYDGVRVIDIGSRQLFSEVSQRFNNEIMIYGDWASTKPRSYDEGGSTPHPRIDYALADKWIIAKHWEKDAKDNWNYDLAASNLIGSQHWSDEISVWGEMRIQQTAQGLPFAIENGPANVAARINVHLHRQTNFKDPLETTDDPWTDDI